MKAYQKILASGIVLTGLAGIVGCGKTEVKAEKDLEKKEYFAQVQVWSNSGMAITNGDFDNDGDLDLIVGAKYPDGTYNANLYYFENDGKGNFSLKYKTE